MLGLGRRRHERELADALAASQDAIRSGVASVDDCLLRYAALAPELEPLLRTSARVETLGRARAPEAARLRARAAFLQAAAAHTETKINPHPAVRRRAWLALTPVAVATVLFAAVAVPVVASMDSNALPGDWNYGFKRATERVRLALTTNPEDRRQLRLEFAQRRLNEIERLSNHGQQVTSHTGEVTTLLRDYTSDIKQVNDTLETTSSVPDSTKQQVTSVVSQAGAVLPQIIDNAPQDAPVNQAAKQAQDETKRTESTAKTSAPAITATAASSPARDHSAAPTTAAASTSPTPAPESATPSVTAAAATPTPAPTQTTTETATATPTATTTPAPTVTSATPPAPTPTPAPTVQPRTAPTLAPATTEPPATTAPQPTRTATELPAAATATGTPSTSETPQPEATASPQPAASAPSTPTSNVSGPVGSSGAGRTGTPTPVPTRSAPLAPTATLITVQNTPSQGVYRYFGNPDSLQDILGAQLSRIAVVYYAGQNEPSQTWVPNTSSPVPVVGPNTTITVVYKTIPTTHP